MYLTRQKRIEGKALSLSPQLCIQQYACSKSEQKQELDIDILARTLWGEARGEGEKGMCAVACVVINRVRVAQEKSSYWWGDTVRDVCQKPYQFSCWNNNDPNREKLEKLSSKDPAFKKALNIARRYVLGFGNDITFGATHYHADYVKPYWVKSLEKTAVVGRHIFYKIGV